MKEQTSAKAIKGRGEALFYRVTCKVCHISVLNLLLFDFSDL